MTAYSAHTSRCQPFVMLAGVLTCHQTTARLLLPHAHAFFSDTLRCCHSDKVTTWCHVGVLCLLNAVTQTCADTLLRMTGIVALLCRRGVALARCQAVVLTCCHTGTEHANMLTRCCDEMRKLGHD